MWWSLPFADKPPAMQGDFKCCPQDFRVTEVLPFQPFGSGEHVFLLVEKTGHNTAHVATALARCAGVAASRVSFSGRKDRHAVTRQWFSVHLQSNLPAQALAAAAGALPDIQILAARRHMRKLRTGVHSANDFMVRIRNIKKGNLRELEQRLERIQTTGVPAYDGYQRFGTGENNVTQARSFFSGSLRADRALRSVLISAARSVIFNEVVAERVRRLTWNRMCPGDVLTFCDNASLITPEKYDETVPARLQRRELLITAPLWGKGALLSRGAVQALEMQCAQRFPLLRQGLEKLNMVHARKAIQLPVQNLRCTHETRDTVVLTFRLYRGGFATTVLRELFRFRDRSLRPDASYCRHGIAGAPA